MCYIVFISHSLQWRYIKIALQEYVINQIKLFMNQNLGWLVVNRKQLQFWKSKILFLCYAPFNSELFLTHPE